MPSIPADLLSYINCIESMPVYKGESTLPKRGVNLLSLYADNNINYMPTNLIVSIWAMLSYYSQFLKINYKLSTA